VSEPVLHTVERGGGDEQIAVVTLNRPEVLNALSQALIAELKTTFASLSADPDVRAIVLTGAGRAFCAGLDLKDEVPLAGDNGDTAASFSFQQRVAGLIPAMRAVRQPIIAAVNGFAGGGGLALTLGSDIRIASPAARFQVTFLKIGASGADIGVSWILPRVIGASKAFELSLTGRECPADEAERIGLVARVVPERDLLPEAIAMGDAIAQHSPFGVWMTKEVIWAQLEVGSLAAGLDLENRTQILATSTGDVGRAVEGFRSGQPPRFAPLD
jgi:enoyl-CoA hydratase